MGIAKMVETQVRTVVSPLVTLMDMLGFSPNALTVLGLLLNLVAAYVVATAPHKPVYGGLAFLFASGFDMLDGALARMRHATSDTGAFLDSVFDRISETALFCALLVLDQQSSSSSTRGGGGADTPVQRQGSLLQHHHFADHAPYAAQLAQQYMPYAILLALAGSLTTSYARARAEGLGTDCRVGVATRAERVVLLTAGLCAGAPYIGYTVYIMATLSWITALQRIVHVAAKLDQNSANGNRKKKLRSGKGY